MPFHPRNARASRKRHQVAAPCRHGFRTMITQNNTAPPDELADTESNHDCRPCRQVGSRRVDDPGQRDGVRNELCSRSIPVICDIAANSTSSTTEVGGRAEDEQRQAQNGRRDHLTIG